MGKLGQKLLYRSRRGSSFTGENESSKRWSSVRSPTKYSLECCPPTSEPKSSGKSSKAEAADAAILNLPTEIWEPIVELLDLTSIIRLRQTCRAFYYCGPKTTQSLFLELKRARDSTSQFARLCFAERARWNKHPPPEMLLCGGCRSHHSIESFTADNVSKQPEERVCLGQQSRLHITPEHSITYKEILPLKENLAPLRCLLTDSRAQTRYGYRPTASVGRRTPYLVSPLYHQYRSQNGHSFDYCWRFSIDKDIVDPPDPLALWEAELSGNSKAIKLCPHIQADNAQVLGAVRKCLSRRVYSHEQAVRIVCDVCEMHVCVMLRIEDPWGPQPDRCHQVIMHVTRYIGQLGCRNDNTYWATGCETHSHDAMQPRWLMQVDEPRIRTVQRIKRPDAPFLFFKDTKYRGSCVTHQGQDFRLIWGQCPRWEN